MKLENEIKSKYYKCEKLLVLSVAYLWNCLTESGLFLKFKDYW